jgi:transcriptional regulator with XRE-family HTH domain
MLREGRKLTQAQLAELLDVSPRTVSRWELGKSRPHRVFWRPYAVALGVSTVTLVGILNGVCGKSL